jgi:hypothetical protein
MIDLFAFAITAQPSLCQTPKVIVIDAGHGGHADSGSRGLDQYNLSEWDHAKVQQLDLVEGRLTLELSREIAATIRRSESAKSGKVKVGMTRAEDTNPNFTERIATAAAAGANLIVSIHFNAGQSATGPVVVYQKQQNNPVYSADRALATALLNSVSTATSRFVPTSKGVAFDDSDAHFTNKNKPYGCYLFYQARRNPKTRNIPVLYLEVEYLQSSKLDRVKKLFVERKREVFAAWAEAIARVLVERVRVLDLTRSRLSILNVELGRLITDPHNPH